MKALDALTAHLEDLQFLGKCKNGTTHYDRGSTAFVVLLMQSRKADMESNDVFFRALKVH
jgi:hypothetical protein